MVFKCVSTSVLYSCTHAIGFNLGKNTKYTNLVSRSHSHAELFLEQNSGVYSRHIAGTLQALYGTSHPWLFVPDSTLQLKKKDINSKSDMRCCPVEKVTAANEQLVHPAAMTALG